MSDKIKDALARGPYFSPEDWATITGKEAEYRSPDFSFDCSNRLHNSGKMSPINCAVCGDVSKCKYNFKRALSPAAKVEGETVGKSYYDKNVAPIMAAIWADIAAICFMEPSDLGLAYAVGHGLLVGGDEAAEEVQKEGLRIKSLESVDGKVGDGVGLTSISHPWPEPGEPEPDYDPFDPKNWGL